MKIKHIRISNVLSFGFAENINAATEIAFNLEKQKGSLHILVGANGSGKSNFLEVLNEYFKKAIFRPFTFDETILIRRRFTTILPENLRGVLSLDQTQQQISNLEKNRNAASYFQSILITIIFSDEDLSNIKFIADNRDTINKLITKYASGVPVIDSFDFTLIPSETEVQISLSKNESIGAFQPNFTTESVVGNESVAVKYYLEYFEALQHLILIHNNYEQTSEEWLPLRRTFAMLGSYRNYSSFASGYTVSAERVKGEQNIKQRLNNESTRLADGGEPVIFEMVKRKLATRFFGELSPKGGEQYAINELKKEEPLKSINTLLDRYLNFTLDVSVPDPLNMYLDFQLRDKHGKSVNIIQLSAGEKGILHFIFSLFGYNLRNGVMIIDEPELHLHPQMQNDFLEIIKDVKQQFDLQFIVATHSPVFIDKDTIQSVYRFYLDEHKNTKIQKPTIDEDQKALVDILNYTNSSRIFFVNKVILVEGKTDEYFFRFYLDFLKHSDSYSLNDEIANYEVLSVGGKESVKAWRRFLEKFRLQVYFIGDWDNIAQVSDVNIKLHKNEYVATQRRSIKDLQGKGSKDGANLFLLFNEYLDNPTEEKFQELVSLRDYIIARRVDYARLIRFIKDNHRERWEQIKTDIESNYSSGIFILKMGELEDYLGIKGKGLDKVIEFCENNFEDWRKNDKYKPCREELESIIKMIFDS